MSALMTKGEREDLQRLVRQREKVLKAAAQQRSAELIADFKNQMGQGFSFNQNEVWAKAMEAADREAKRVSGTIVTARCRELGIPDRFAPSLSLCWHGRGYDNSVDRRKSELLGMAKSKIAALEAKAIVEIGIECSRGADRNRIGRPDERRGAGVHREAHAARNAHAEAFF